MKAFHDIIPSFVFLLCVSIVVYYNNQLRDFNNFNHFRLPRLYILRLYILYICTYIYIYIYTVVKFYILFIVKTIFGDTTYILDRVTRTPFGASSIRN